MDFVSVDSVYEAHAQCDLWTPKMLIMKLPKRVHSHPIGMAKIVLEDRT